MTFNPNHGHSLAATPTTQRTHQGYAEYYPSSLNEYQIPLPVQPTQQMPHQPPQQPQSTTTHTINPMMMHQQIYGQPSSHVTTNQYPPNMGQYYPPPPPATIPQPPPATIPAHFDPMQFMNHAGAAAGMNVWNTQPAYPVAPTSLAAHPDPSFDAEAELLFLNKLEKKAFNLQQKGHHLYAIELMEQSVASRKLLYGPLSEEVMVAAEKLALLYNSLAMSSLYKEEYKQSLRLLRKAELLTSHISALTSVRVQTLNNLACCYRRLQRPKTALNLLRESLVLLSAEQTSEGRPVTHLNMCAILSQLHRHDEALDHAKAAVMHCQKQLLQDDPRKLRQEAANASGRANKKSSHRHPDEEYDSDASNESTADAAATAAAVHQLLTEKIVILSIAYHNLGVEEEFLKNYDSCLEWYGKALQVAEEHVGANEEITKTFRESYIAAKKQIDFLQAQAAAATQQRTNGRRSRPSSAAPSSHLRAPSTSSQRPTSASTSGSSAAGARRVRPSSAAPPSSRPTDSSSLAGSYSQAPRAHHSASQVEFNTTQPSYLQGTTQSASRQRPKSASISRPPRPK